MPSGYTSAGPLCRVTRFTQREIPPGGHALLLGGSLFRCAPPRNLRSDNTPPRRDVVKHACRIRRKTERGTHRPWGESPPMRSRRPPSPNPTANSVGIGRGVAAAQPAAEPLTVRECASISARKGTGGRAVTRRRQHVAPGNQRRAAANLRRTRRPSLRPHPARRCPPLPALQRRLLAIRPLLSALPHPHARMAFRVDRTVSLPLRVLPPSGRAPERATVAGGSFGSFGLRVNVPARSRSLRKCSQQGSWSPGTSWRSHRCSACDTSGAIESGPPTRLNWRGRCLSPWA